MAALSSRSRRGNEADLANPRADIREPKPDDRLLTSATTNELPHLLILTSGDAETNRQFFAEHKVGCPVLLQNDGEVAKACQANGTPSGYLISPDGKIASELTLGAEALLALAAGKSEIRPAATVRQRGENSRSEMDQSLLTSAATDEGEGRTDRFGNHSLARTKINRDGLKAGARAPDFRLPRLDGRGDLTLSELRGKRVFLVFSSPGCGPCNALAPELEKFHRTAQGSAGDSPAPLGDSPSGMVMSNVPGATHFQAMHRSVPSGESREGTGRSPVLPVGQGSETPSITVVMISKGEPKENRAKVKEHGLTFPVVLQQQWEISRRYAMFATPIAYVIDEAGVISDDVAVGLEPILALMAKSKGSDLVPELI